MVTVDAVKQLHAAALQPEDADSIADLGPFGIKVSSNELIGEVANLERRRRDMLPVDGVITRQRDRTRQDHRLTGEEAQMLHRFRSIARLVEQLPIAANDAVATDHP